jgi:hypothetical protein
MPVDQDAVRDVISRIEELEADSTPAEERVLTSSRRRLEDLI